MSAKFDKQQRTQKWFCRVCEKRGVINYESGAGVMEVYYKIGDAHNTASPGCDDGNVQVVNEEVISAEELADIEKLVAVA